MIIYRIIVTIVPLLTTPYISRVLLPEDIGNYSYTQSICAYFGAFAGLGVNIYGQREIAFLKNDKQAYSKTFWEIIIIRLATTFISCCIYLYLVSSYFDWRLKIYFLIQIIDLFGGLLDISWLFFGLENFLIVIKKNLFLKLLTIGGIFLFVKKPEDIYIYVCINSIALIFSGLIFWVDIRHYVKKVLIRDLQFTKHIWPMVTLFLPSVAETLYNKLDITMLGFMVKNSIETAYYQQTVKISTIASTTIATVGGVIAPRLAYVFANESKEQLEGYFWKGFDAFCIVGIPISFGLYAIADTLVPWFLGNQYAKVGVLLQIMAPVCLSNGINNYLGSQYLIATKRQTRYTFIVLIGLLINVLCNYISIPLLKSKGAIIASLVSESFILGLEIYTIQKEINIQKILNIMPKKLLSGLFMCASVRMFSLVTLNLTTKVICQILLGIVIYGIMLLVFKDPLTFEIIQKVLKYRKE